MLQVKRKLKNASSKSSLGVRKIRYKEKTLLCNKVKVMFFLVYNKFEIKYTICTSNVYKYTL